MGGVEGRGWMGGQVVGEGLEEMMERAGSEHLPQHSESKEGGQGCW